jgi:hypothetical protein
VARGREESQRGLLGRDLSSVVARISPSGGVKPSPRRPSASPIRTFDAPLSLNLVSELQLRAVP